MAPSDTSAERTEAGGPPSEDPPPFERVRNITLISRLGRGGMGSVWLGRDEVLGRQVAVKCIRTGLLSDPVARTRFRREARLLSQLEHPHICRVYDFVATPEADVLVMELLEGETLVDAAPGLDTDAKLRIALQITRALAAAHQQGIIHRDLKPQNVLVDRRGDARVLDFGLARLHDDEADAIGTRPEWTAPGDSADGEETAGTRLGSVVGSPPYMSPEQAAGETLGPASDLYSLGLLIQELFEGRRAAEARDPIQLVRQAYEGISRPMSEGDPDLVRLVEALKSREPAARPTAHEVRERLEWILGRRRRRVVRLSVVAGLVILALGAVKYTTDLRRERERALEARSRAEALVAFVVDDLYRGLEPLGRLDLLEAAADQALAHYDEFAPGPEPGRRFRRAAAHKNSGRVLEYQGRYEDAAEAYERSVEDLERLLADHPGAPEAPLWRRTLASALALIGRVCQEQGRLTEALDLRRRALELRRSVEAAATPSERAARTEERLRDQAEIAWLEREIGRSDAALAALEAVLEEAEALAGETRRVRSVVFSYRGTVHFENGRWGLALADFERARELDRAMWRDTGDARRRYDQLLSTSRIGETLLRLGRTEAAVEAFLRAQELGRELVAADPLDADRKRELAVAHTNLAIVYDGLGRPEDSLAETERALAISRELFANDPSNASYRNDVAADLITAGIALEALGQGPEARRHWMESLDLVRPLVDHEEESSPFYAATLSTALLLLGRAEEARPHLEALAAVGWTDPELAGLAAQKGLAGLVSAGPSETDLDG